LTRGRIAGDLVWHSAASAAGPWNAGWQYAGKSRRHPRQKCPVSFWDLDPIYYTVPWAHPSSYAKRHLDRFSRVCWTHGRYR